MRSFVHHGTALRARLTLAAIAFAAFACSVPPAEANPRYAALVRDVTTGRVLFAREPHEQRHPASLAKMMTLYVLFEEMGAGRMSLDTPLFVSPHAAAQPAMKLALDAGESILVEDAIKAIVTSSSNDVAVVIAEAVSGTESAFAERMTRTARDLGMTATRFTNASGLPDPEQVTSAWDMGLLGAALEARFPDEFRYFDTERFEFRGRTYVSHNRVSRDVDGANGIKTGYIRASGFNLVTSVRRDGRKIIAVVLGGRTAQTRDAHMRELIEEHMPRAEPGSGYADDVVAAIRPKGDRGLAYAVQIGAFPTAAAALTRLEAAQAKNPEVLAERTPLIDRAEDRVRARFAGFEDRAAAQAACRALREDGLTCRVGVL